jgi:predicted phosphoribosyltransferase
MFVDRKEAGRRLAKALVDYRDQDAVVLAIPRGGVIVGVEIAEDLKIPLDVIIPRKIGAPGNPELAIGAVAGDGRVFLNEELCQQLDISDEYIREEVAVQLREIERRRQLYLGGRPPVVLRKKIVIITDDGLATGYTALAAINAVKQGEPKKVILAIPVAPKDTYERVKREVDEIICLELPELFFAVGQFYVDFRQITDKEVVEALKRFQKSQEA